LFEVFIPNAYTRRSDVLEIILSDRRINKTSKTKAIVAQYEKCYDYDDNPFDESPVGMHVR